MWKYWIQNTCQIKYGDKNHKVNPNAIEQYKIKLFSLETTEKTECHGLKNFSLSVNKKEQNCRV